MKLRFGVNCSISYSAIVLRHLIFYFDLLSIIAWFSFVQLLFIPSCFRRWICSSDLLSLSLRYFLSILFIDALLFLIANKLSVWQKIFFSAPFLLGSKKDLIVNEDLVRIVSVRNAKLLLLMVIRVFVFKEIVSWILGALWTLYLLTSNYSSLIVNWDVI